MEQVCVYVGGDYSYEIRGTSSSQTGLRRKSIPTVKNLQVILKVRQKLSFYGDKERNGVVEEKMS